MGRAPTLYAAWLVARDGISPVQAVEMLHERRPLVMPTHRQLTALQFWATTLAPGAR
jgi:protein-tyrosine phosphatase